MYLHRLVNAVTRTALQLMYSTLNSIIHATVIIFIANCRVGCVPRIFCLSTIYILCKFLSEYYLYKQNTNDDNYKLCISILTFLIWPWKLFVIIVGRVHQQLRQICLVCATKSVHIDDSRLIMVVLRVPKCTFHNDIFRCLM